MECLGSGRVFERMQGLYGSPFAIETTHVKFKNSDLVAEVTRHLSATACQYRESFDVYGSVRAFEWARVDGEEHVVHLGETPQRVPVPDFAERLPEPIRRFTTAVFTAAEAAAPNVHSCRVAVTEGHTRTSCTAS